MTESRLPAISKTLAELVQDGDRINLTTVSEDTYKRFRCLEPSLASCLDELKNKSHARTFFVAVEIDGQPVAVTSLVVQSNPRRSSPLTAYGRIDLVIVDSEFRSLRLGRLVVTAALLELLEKFGTQLYSVSCLAAHPAIERILDSFGFTKTLRGEKNYVHEEIKLQGDDHIQMRSNLTDALTECLQQSRFHIRQVLGKATT